VEECSLLALLDLIGSVVAHVIVLACRVTNNLEVDSVLNVVASIVIASNRFGESTNSG